LLFGAGVVAMTVLFGNKIPGEVVNGGYTNITIAWGLGVVMGIYIAGKVTGAHLNPAVTLTLAVFRGFSWGKVAPYMLAQVAGGAIVFFNYRLQFEKVDPLLEKTAGVFATFPAFPGAPMAGLVDQIIGTAILLMMILAITDERNQQPGILAPLLIGLVVVGIG